MEYYSAVKKKQKGITEPQIVNSSTERCFICVSNALTLRIGLSKTECMREI